MPDAPHLELVHVYDPGPDAVVPDLVELPGVARSDYPLTVEETTTHPDPGKDPVAVVSVTTARTSRAIFDEHDTIIAELVDEVTTATRRGESTSWRRWELRSDDPALLDAADELLLESGIGTSDLADPLGDFLGVRRPPLDEAVGRSTPAGRVLQVRLRAQVDALHLADAEVRLGEAAGVHHVRVACRRLRAALSTFGPLLPADVRDPVRDELGWLARSLGGARDQHVVRERLVALVEAEDEVAGPLLERIRAADWAGSDDDPGTEVLESQRYVELLRSLDALVADPAWTPAAEEEAGPFLRRRLAKDWDRLARRVATVADVEPGSAPDEALHDIRKAAKRLRYALEAAELVWRRKPRRLRKHVRELTRVLGERQDTVVSRAALLRLAAQADAAGEPTFTHGRLDHVEELRAAELEKRLRRDWAAAVRQRKTWP